MTALAMKLPTLEAEQFNLPGLQMYVVPAPVYDHQPLPEPPLDLYCPGQLGFEANQETLIEQNSTARQLPLLADPPVWDLQPQAPARRPASRRRSARKGTNQRLSPGQMSLF